MSKAGRAGSGAGFLSSFLAGGVCLAVGVLASLVSLAETNWVLGAVAVIVLVAAAYSNYRATGSSSLPGWARVLLLVVSVTLVLGSIAVVIWLWPITARVHVRVDADRSGVAELHDPLAGDIGELRLVRLRNPDEQRSAETGPGGIARFPNLNAGDYSILTGGGSEYPVNFNILHKKEHIPVTATPTPTNTATPTPTWTPTPTPTPTATEEARILQDFEGPGKFNWFTLGSHSDVFKYGKVSDQAHSGMYSFWVYYEKSEIQQFLGADPTEASLTDLRKAKALQIWVYGEVTILLKLENRLDSGDALDVEKQTATDPDGWTLLTFDITKVAGKMDLSSVKLLFFVAPGQPSETGTFYLDDISVVE